MFKLGSTPARTGSACLSLLIALTATPLFSVLPVLPSPELPVGVGVFTTKSYFEACCTEHVPGCPGARATGAGQGTGRLAQRVFYQRPILRRGSKRRFGRDRQARLRSGCIGRSDACREIKGSYITRDGMGPNVQVDLD